MTEQTKQPSVAEIEQAFLRKAWVVFPVLGLLGALTGSTGFWNWVNGEPVSLQWRALAAWSSWGIILGFSLVPVLWRLGLARAARIPRWAMWVVVVWAVAGGEMLVRISQVQTAVWLSARTRLDAGQHFMREVCFVRLEEAVGRDQPAPAAVLVGSSQMLHGVDPEQLAQLQPRPVIRRAMFGMTPLKALAMRAFMPFQPGDICIQYLSEFDFTNQDEFPFSWFRPYASWQTWPDVMACISPRVAVRHWRQVVDYVMAATTEWWRARDFFQVTLFHFWGGRPAGTGETVMPDLAAAAAAKARGALSPAPAEWKAMDKFSRHLAAAGVRPWVFEGDVNPAIYSAERLQEKQVTRVRLAELMKTTGGRYISLEEQALDLDAGQWLDMTHLNASGCDRLTRCIARELQAP